MWTIWFAHKNYKSQQNRIRSYLLPDDYMEDYAGLLDVDLEIIRTVGELCDVPNYVKERLMVKKKIINPNKLLLLNAFKQLEESPKLKVFN